MKIFFLLCVLPMLASAAPTKTLVIVGDSLTEGYGVAKDNAYPQLVEKELKNWKVINSGISGSTTASAPGRMRWALKSKPDAILLALGANDGLRGFDTEEVYKNLEQAIDIAQAAKVKILLAGILAAPNYGPEYTKAFAAIFPKLAKEKKVPLYPFLIEGVAGNTKMNLADGIHPNEAGHKKMAELILPFLKKELL